MSVCHRLLLCERVRASNGDHAFRLQLRCRSVNVRLGASVVASHPPSFGVGLETGHLSRQTRF